MKLSAGYLEALGCLLGWPTELEELLVVAWPAGALLIAAWIYFSGRPRAISEIKRRYAVTDDDPPGALPGRSLAELSIVDMQGTQGR